MAFRLNTDVHVCETGGAFVVMDLAADRYFALTPEQSTALRALMAADADLPLEGAASALTPLLDAGLLTTSDADGRPLAATCARPPIAALDDDAYPGRMTPGRLLRFIVSVHGARRRLRRQPIRTVVSELRDKTPKATDFGVVAELATAFRRLRPLYPAPRRCLFESLALVLFLSSYGVRPAWVFGVRLDPWKAHCWVEIDGLLLNDALEEVAEFKPILVA